MIRCPHCAESIQDAARICPHCRRRVQPRRWLRVVAVLLGAGVLLVAASTANQLMDDRRAYNVWQGERADWHRHCDGFVGKAEHAVQPHQVVAYRDCQQELTRLMAVARRHNWIEQR